MSRECRECGHEWGGVGACPECGHQQPIGHLETVYDAEVAPLVAGVIEICKREGIGLFLTACLDGDLKCTTAIPPPDGADASHHDAVRGCVRAVRHRWPVMAPGDLIKVALGGLPALSRLTASHEGERDARTDFPGPAE